LDWRRVLGWMMRIVGEEKDCPVCKSRLNGKCRGVESLVLSTVSANIEELVDEAEGMNILTVRKGSPFKRAMSNSFGFGGTNCALVFDKYEE
jgi:hypothetical protein